MLTACERSPEGGIDLQSVASKASERLYSAIYQVGKRTGAGFHKQPAEFQRHHRNLLQRLTPKHGLKEVCFHTNFAAISTKRILTIVMPGKIMA